MYFALSRLAPEAHANLRRAVPCPFTCQSTIDKVHVPCRAVPLVPIYDWQEGVGQVGASRGK